MRKWGVGEWLAVLFFTWWIPFAIYGYFTRGEDPALRKRPQFTQEEKNKVYADMCADARWKAQRPNLEPRELDQLTKNAEAICGLTIPLIKAPEATTKKGP